ncbi:MAG TPA: Uma2 family endonuclease [Pyrinomonadaceae bacterium]
MTSRIDALLTIADLEAMPDDDGNRYELIEGELFVSCAPGLTHQIVSDNIVHLIRRYLDENPIGTVVSTIGLILSNYSGVIPDIVFFKRESTTRVVSGERLTSAPELVIEILSPGSENIRRDRIAKRRLYGKHEVPEYWLIDREQKSVEVYRLLERELRLVAILQGDDSLTTPSLPGFSCRASEIFILPPLSNQ